MYDILQLNELLVPELLDIAEKQNIPNAESLQKQELIYQILDNQSAMTPEKKETSPTEKTKRKRIVKPAAAKEASNVKKEEAVVEPAVEKPEEKRDDRKKIVKKHKDVAPESNGQADKCRS